MKPFFSLLIFLAVASFCADIACKVIDMKASVCISADEEESSESDESESDTEGKIKLREFEFISFGIQYEYCFTPENSGFKSVFAFRPDLGQYTQTQLFSPPEMM